MTGLSSFAACSMETTALVTLRSFASPATSSSAIKQRAIPPCASSTFLLTPESAIFVSVTISAPVRIRCFAISTAFSEKVSVSAYPKSALVWITLFVTGSCSFGITIPRSSSSFVIIAKLRPSISPGSTNSTAPVLCTSWAVVPTLSAHSCLFALSLCSFESSFTLSIRSSDFSFIRSMHSTACAFPWISLSTSANIRFCSSDFTAIR